MTTPDRDEPHAPVRSCLGCRTRRTSDQLVRITRTAGTVVADGASSGRGAWLCRDQPDCLDAAIRRGAFGKAWRSTISADDELAIRTAVEQRQ